MIQKLSSSSNPLKRNGLVALEFLHIAVGAWLGGLLIDLTHSYTIRMWVSLACLVVSVFIVWASNQPSIRNQKGNSE
jgi:predicted MFS family arabinose efflux permease